MQDLETLSGRVERHTAGLVPGGSRPVERAGGSAAPTNPGWVAEPEVGDPAVREATGRGWDEWREVIDRWPGHTDGHAAVARYLTEEHGVEGWWAQSVTVGWERITGRRLPQQRLDGTFSANRSRTLAADPVRLRELLLDEAGRAALFPGLQPELRSRPTSKNVRVGLDVGSAEIALAPRDDGRVAVTIQHERLGSPEEVTAWKAYWGAWLEALDEA